MKHLVKVWAIISLLVLALASCKPEEEVAVERECSFSIEYPLGVSQASYTDKKVVLKSNKDGKEVVLTPKDNTFAQRLLEGSYQIIFSANFSYQSPKFGKVDTTISSEEQVVVKAGQTSFKITPQYVENISAGFVIEELFFSPSVDPKTGKQFRYVEQYIKITNNSDVTLYADSLGIIQSQNQTNMKRDYHNSILNRALPIDFLSIIPGDGKSHPVKPGGSLIIANDAQDHSKVFAGAADLSHAHFEIYDLSSNPKVQDVDNLAVPNLVSYYKSSETVSSFHQRGCTTIALAKIPISVEEFSKDFAWEGKYTFRFNEFVKEMSDKCYQVPHSWLIDVVNLGIADKVDWLFVPATLDSGFTGWKDSFNAKEGDGTAVIRKIDHEKGGRQYLKDTNNSTEDFNRHVTPSLKQK